jgi:peptidoglycan/LPS O-acetylase OafA/YrhL
MAESGQKDSRHNVAIDYLRAFVVVLVLTHHSVIAYAPYAHFDPTHYLWGAPIVDSERWLGFDLLTLFNDTFFMALMFFLSGLFVWPSVARKGCATFLRDRGLRLAVPFALIVTFLMPIAYYPSFWMTGADTGFAAFWWQCISVKDWPSGPAWFIWLLLAFDCVAAGLYRVASGSGAVFDRLTSRASRDPMVFFTLLVAISALGYLPMLLAFGSARWFTFGPFSVQASRLVLYFVYFLAGIVVGAYGVDKGVLAHGGRLERRWAIWLCAALAFYVLVVAFEVVRSESGGRSPSSLWQTTSGLAFVLSCGASGFGLLACFLRFANQRVRVFDALHDSAYGMYLIHYVFVIWLQYALLWVSLPAVAKAAAVFTGTLTLSWGAVAVLRRIPAVAKII